MELQNVYLVLGAEYTMNSGRGKAGSTGFAFVKLQLAVYGLT